MVQRKATTLWAARKVSQKLVSDGVAARSRDRFPSIGAGAGTPERAHDSRAAIRHPQKRVGGPKCWQLDGGNSQR